MLYRVEVSAQKTPILALMPEAQVSDVPLWLVVRSGAQTGARLLISQAPTYVGSNPALAQLVIVGPRVAERHASIQRLGSGAVINDLASGTGTLVNGAPLLPFTPYLVHPGALVNIGGVILECSAAGGDLARVPTEIIEAEPHEPAAVPPHPAITSDSSADISDAGPVPEAILGKYRLIRPLGIGSASQVLLADDRERKRLVALKLATDANPSTAATFQREGRMGLRQSHIARVYESGVIDGQTYIAIEYVAGPSLRQLLDGTPISLDLALAIIGQTLDALAYAHRRGVIHCDIKPENILLTPQAGVKLIDFGISRNLTAPEDDLGLRAGTPQYMSYEQAVGQPVGAESDTYAAAVVLYELLTGRAPFVSASIAQVARQRRYQMPIPPRSYNPTIPLRVEAALLRALLHERADRFITADSFAAALGCPSDLLAQRTIDDALSASESHQATAALNAATR
jgi:eukaryotic-like serine/threonine-protein kinase